MADKKKDTDKTSCEAMEIDVPETPKMEAKTRKQQSDNQKSGDESSKGGNDKLSLNKVIAQKRTASERKSEDSASEESITDGKEGSLKEKGARSSEKGELNITFSCLYILRFLF